MEGKKSNDFLDEKKSSFFSLLKSSGKWKEFFIDRVSIVALLMSCCMVIILDYLFHSADIEIFNNVIQGLIEIIIGSLIGMLGFIISGMAIFTGTITNKLVENIDEDQKADSLIGILYSFYFVGAIIGVAIVSYVFMYVFCYSNIPVTRFFIITIGGGLSYLFTWIIFYSVSLLGTCLKLFLVSYKYKDIKKK